MQTLNKIWAPNPGSQKLFLSCPIREALLEGTRGGGKTDALLMDFAQHCGMGYGASWTGILFRETYKQLDDVIKKSKKWFYQIFRGIRFVDYTWKWPTGEELLLRHMDSPDDYWNYHGHEYPWIAWEELTNWRSLECYESMLACNRSSDPRVPKKVRATTNPYGKGHNAVKAYFIDPMPRGTVFSDEREVPMIDESGAVVLKPAVMKRVAIHSSYLENPQLMRADPLYLANIDKISDVNKRKAWLFGDWDITSGGMFDDIYRKDRHELPVFEIPPSWRLERAFDWGSSKPFSCGWWGISDGTPVTIAGYQRTFPPRSRIRFAEWYGCAEGKPNVGLLLTAKKVAEGIVKKEKDLKIHGRVKPGPADSSIYDVTDETSIATNMADAGVTWVPGDKRAGSRKNGWELIRSMLESAADNKLDSPGLWVMDRNRHWIRTVPSLPRDEDDPDDVDTEAEDHAGDETRYEVLGPKPKTSSSQPLSV